MYGHKRIFIIGWLWFAVSSFITGFSYASSNIVLFSVCRAFQGIGPALLVPNAIALLARNFAVGTQRNTAFACFGAAGPTGATAGAVFTALIAQLAWWPWCFWILTIVCLLVAGLALFVIPGAPSDLFKSSATKSKLTFDYWGCLTGVCGLVLVNFALNQAPLVGWTTWYIPSLLILGCAFLWTFAIVELNFTKDPLIPIRGLGKDAYFALACIAAGWGSHGIWAYYLYLFVSLYNLSYGAELTGNSSNKCKGIVLFSHRP
jgi:MFS family permease